MRSTLLLLVVVFVVLADALVQIPVRQQKVPTNTRAYKHRMAKQMAALKKTMGEEHLHHFKSLLASQKGSLGISDLVGEIQLGTPAQTFSTLFISWEQDVYVIDPNASGVKGSKARYDSSASSTSKPTGVNFTTLWGDTFGHIVNDVITIGGVQAPVNVGVADWLKDWSTVSWTDADAVFGLLVHTDNSYYAQSNISVLGQLADTVLDQPIVTVLIRDFGWNASATVNGALTIGGLDVTNCGASYVQAPKLNEWNLVNLTSVSIGSYSQSPSYSLVFVEPWFDSIYVSNNLFDAIISATGASYNRSSSAYTVDCSKLSSLPVLTLTLGGGAQLAVTADDYVSVQSDGTCVLVVDGGGDDNINLGESFMRNHCVSNDFKNNLLGLSRVNPPTPA